MPMDRLKKYKIVISKDALLDIKSTKKYILDTTKISNLTVQCRRSTDGVTSILPFG